MHGRSHMTVDHRISATLGRSTPGFADLEASFFALYAKRREALGESHEG